MKAKIITGSTPRSGRVSLGEVLPLEIPLSTVIGPVFGCNFKCKYCVHGGDKEKNPYISSERVMDFELYKNYVYGIKEMGHKLKRLSFAGVGEPLLHKNIVDMVKLAKDEDIAESVEITSNGSCLTHELSDGLIEAGLDMLRISVQGTTDEKYYDISDVHLKVGNLVEELKYFYEHKKESLIYVKIIDCALDDEEDKNRFFELFGDACDLIGVEALIENARIDYEELSSGNEMNKTLYGKNMLHTDICPQPFFTMMISAGGEVSPCCSMSTPIIVGNLKKESIKEICTGETLRKLRYQMLVDRDKTCEVCKNCMYYKHVLFEEDILDNYKEKLLKAYSN